MAAPFVSGAAALLLSQNPSLTSQRVAGLLKTSARREIAEPAWEIRRGFGVLDVPNALVALNPSDARLDLSATLVTVTRDTIGDDTAARILVTPLSADGLPLQGGWTAQVDVLPEEGDALVQRVDPPDPFTAAFALRRGTARGDAVVRATINGQVLVSTPTLTFHPRAQVPPTGRVMGSGCATTPRATRPIWVLRR
jgi:subtilisin family serine protease